MPDDNFHFDIGAKRIRKTDDEVLSSLGEYAARVDYRYFSTTEYDKWKEKKVCADTIIERFGSWKKALTLLGIGSGRERRYSPEQLIDNLEKIWKELGYPPGKRQIGKLGEKISEHPYKSVWGSVRSACEYLANYHNGKIAREELLQGTVSKSIRTNVPLTIRWVVLKKDNYSCVKCGRSPAKDHSVTLEIDHKIPVARGGTNEIDNLQTLCEKCNRGKKDKIE